MTVVKKLTFAVVLTMLLTLGASSAVADTFFLTNANTSGTPPLSAFSGPYARVDVTLLSGGTQAQLVYTGLNNGTQGFLFVDGGSVAANTNGGAFLSASGLAPVTGGFNQATYSNGGTGNEDGFGSFNAQVNSSDSFGDASQTITMIVQKASGTWSSVANVFTANDSGQILAAHIAACTLVSGGCLQANGALTTGFVVPEPRLLSVLALGMLGLLFQARRNSSAKTSN